MIKLILLAIISVHVDTVMIQWGSRKGELGIKIQTHEDAGPNMGPLAFDVENGKIVFIDIYNNRLEYFDKYGKFQKEVRLDGFPNNIILWNGQTYLTSMSREGIKFLKLSEGKIKTVTTINVRRPLVRNSVEFLKDFKNRALLVSYKMLNGEKIRSYFTLFNEGLKAEDFIQGDPSSGKNSTIIGYDEKGVPVSAWFDGRVFHFKHGSDTFSWNPIFYALMDAAPYRIEKDGTLYIVNYKKEGVEILEVRW